MKGKYYGTSKLCCFSFTQHIMYLFLNFDIVYSLYLSIVVI